MNSSSHSRRRIFAIALSGIWICGFELGPNIHIGLHHLWGHHTHQGDSKTASKKSPHSHSHSHSHSYQPSSTHPFGNFSLKEPLQFADVSQDDKTPPGEETDAPLSHGNDSPAHRGLAAISPGPAVPELLPLPATDGPNITFWQSSLCSRVLSPSCARGPPIV